MGGKANSAEGAEEKIGEIDLTKHMLEQSPGKRLTIRPQDRTRVAIVTVVLIRKMKAL
jgi:hypothetical protein